MNLASVDPALIDAIGRVESGHNTAAIRFEPALFARPLTTAALVIVQRIMRANNCGATTAHMIYSTSWGEFQILGENLYSVCDWRGTISRYLANTDDVQSDSLGAFLMAKRLDFTAADLLGDDAKLTQFVTGYNGPGNTAQYSARLLEALRTP